MEDHLCNDNTCVMCTAYKERLIMYANMLEYQDATYDWDDTHEFIQRLYTKND